LNVLILITAELSGSCWMEVVIHGLQDEMWLCPQNIYRNQIITHTGKQQYVLNITFIKVFAQTSATAISMRPPLQKLLFW
jgi:hypothetical protein